MQYRKVKTLMSSNVKKAVTDQLIVLAITSNALYVN
jgi:hypothetical protein